MVEMVIDLRWLTIIGLACDFAGAILMAYSLILSKKKAIELGVSRFSSNIDEENLKLPEVRDRLTQSRNAEIGVTLLAIGFLLQIIAGWPF